MSTSEITPQQLLEQLDDEQREVALHQSGAICVLAGAGTGKTRAITYRIAYGVHTGAVDPENVLAVTFTQKAAGEMQARLAKLGVERVQARTFHASALLQISHFWPNVIGGRPPEILERKAAIIAAAAGRLNIQVDKAVMRDLAREIEWAKSSMISPENYLEKAKLAGHEGVADIPVNRVADLLDAYEEAKAQREVIDFEDILLINAGMIEQREDVARAVRNQYRYFVVDEYQDVSPLEHYLLMRWLGDRRNLCVVGDVAQTIYSFAGACPEYLANFTLSYPEATVVRLVRDYRSTPEVVELANRVLSKARADDGKPLRGTVTLVSQKKTGPKVVFSSFENDFAEANYVAEQIRALNARGESLTDIAILYRARSQSSSYEQALGQAQIPYLVRGGEEFFKREEIRSTILALRAEAKRVPAEPIDLEERVKRVLITRGWDPNAQFREGEVGDRWAALAALLEFTKDEECRGKDLAEFVRILEARGSYQLGLPIQGVTLTTLHAAKGLEWKTVFLVGVAEGLLPINLAKDAASKEEERRLLYVGVTRAKENLHISYSQEKYSGQKRKRKMSNFLEGIWPKGSLVVPAAKPAGEGRHLESNNPLSEEALIRLEALRRWREETAIATGVSAANVLSDPILRSIAKGNPKTLSALGTVKDMGVNRLNTWGGEILQLLRRIESTDQ